MIRPPIPSIRDLGWGDPTWKDQNSSIHLMEALTILYQVLPTSIVKERLEEMLHLVRDTMVNPGGFLHLYFDQDWQPINHQDSSRAFILENLKYDHKSFGHDIETAYLLIEAAEVLYGKADPKTIEVAKKLVDHTIKYGFDQDFYGLFDRGYRFDQTGEIEIVNRQKVWWAQAEAWHALALISQFFPEDPTYPEACQKMWDYIKKEMIDTEHGGWYSSGLDENPESKMNKKASPWKGAYHNGRALMQVAKGRSFPLED